MERNFDGFSKITLQTKAALVAHINLSIIHWSLSEKKDIGTNQLAENPVLCKAAD